MESTTNDEELEYTSDEQVHMGDSPSKDLADSNSLHQELSQLHDKQSPNALKPLTSSTPLAEPRIQETVDSIKSTPDELSSLSFTEKDFNIAVNLPEEISEEKGKISTENTIIASENICSKSSSVSPEVTVSDLPGETGSIEVTVLDLSRATGSTEETVSDLPGVTGSTAEAVSNLPGETESTEEVSELPGETESTKVTVSDVPEETGSTEVTVSDLPEETGSTEVTVSDLPGETGSTKVTVLELSEVTGSTEEIVSTLPEESRSAEIIVSALSGETDRLTNVTLSTISQTASTEVHQPVLSEETESTEVFQLAVSEEARLNEAVQSPFDLSMSIRNKEALTSSDNKLAKIAQNDINPSTLAENSSEKVSGTAMHLSSSEDPSDSSRLAANDTGISTFLQDYEKYVKEEFDVDRGECGSRVMDNYSPAIKPLSPNFQKPPVSLPTNSSLGLHKPFSPADDSAVSKAMSSDTSLSAWLSVLTQWVSRNLDKTSSYPEKAKFSDLKVYAEKEIIYGLYVLIQLNKRVDTLLQAANGLPDPAPLLLRGLGSQRSMILDAINDAGTNLRRRIKALEVEATDDYDKFLLFCQDNSELNCDESYVKQIKDIAFNIITNSFVNTSDNVIMLSFEIGNFRSKIREFCSEIDKLL